MLTLVDGKGRKLVGWIRRESAGSRNLWLPLPRNARHPGSDKLRITAAGSPVAKILRAIMH